MTQNRPKARGSHHRDRGETRAAILDAAERIFAAAGLEGARTDAIAAAAGVNKALLYYYFKSKHGLYRTVLEKHLSDFDRQANEVLDSRGSPRSILLRYISLYFDFIGARPYYARLFQRVVMAEEKWLERMAREHFLPRSRKLLKVIERGKRSGEFRRLDSTHTAISSIALTLFYFSAAHVMRLVSGQDPYAKPNLARRKREVLRFIRYALFRKPEARVQ